ncbi:hypothetical protein [Alistipes indistinctus]
MAVSAEWFILNISVQVVADHTLFDLSAAHRTFGLQEFPYP